MSQKSLPKTKQLAQYLNHLMRYNVWKIKLFQFLSANSFANSKVTKFNYICGGTWIDSCMLIQYCDRWHPDSCAYQIASLFYIACFRFQHYWSKGDNSSYDTKTHGVVSLISHDCIFFYKTMRLNSKVQCGMLFLNIVTYFSLFCC